MIDLGASGGDAGRVGSAVAAFHPLPDAAAEVPFDPCDLPGYAARLVRLHPAGAQVQYEAEQVAIARAQKNGDLPAHFHPGFPPPWARVHLREAGRPSTLMRVSSHEESQLS